MNDDEFTLLKKDISKNGLLEPITLYDSQILDGRNRFMACEDLGIVPDFRDFKNGDPLSFVISLNLHRRHLTTSQRAVLASEVANMEVGRNWTKSPDKNTNKQSADLFNVGTTAIKEAKAIKRESPEKFEKIKSGELTLQQAKREIIKQNKKEQPELPTDKYRVIYADPPWDYGNDFTKAMPGSTRPNDYYPTMTISEICEMEISDILDDNAVLFLWVTSPLLEDSFKIIKAWDFKYKTSFVWDKVKHNFGYYNSVRHEFLLIATKGSCIPDIKKLYDSVVLIERTKHSEKPEYFRNLIDELYPHGKRIELFARNKYENWDDWGNEL